MSETCANCGAAIGNLETAHVWNDHVVCGPCSQRLGTASAPAAAVEPIPYASPGTPPPPGPIQPQVVYVQPAAGGMHPMVLTGLILFFVGLPFCCLFLPLGIVMIVAGLLLMIVGGFM